MSIPNNLKEKPTMGIKYDMPMGDYLALDALSSSVAYKALTLSPAHALHYKATERNHKDADRGQIIHQLLLEGHEDNLVPIDAEDYRTKAAKEARDAAYAEGKFPILANQFVSRDLIPNKQSEYKRLGSIINDARLAGMVSAPQGGITDKARAYLNQLQNTEMPELEWVYPKETHR